MSNERKIARYNYIDVLRVVSSFAVIAIHVIMYYIATFKTRSTPWTGLMSGKVLTQFAVPVFFMISGATIFSSTREESYGSFIKRRLSKVAIPFVTYSIIYYLFYVFIKGEYELGVYDFVTRFFRMDIQGHFWYMYALIALYFLYPALKKFVQSITKNQLLTVIIVIFVIDSLLPLFNQFIKVILDIEKFKISSYSFGKLGVYLNYTLIGYYIHTYVPANKKNGFLAALAGLASVVSMFALTLHTSVKSFDQSWIDRHWAFVVIQAASVVILTKCLYEKKQLRPFPQKLLSTLGALSFSAYLVHMLVLRWVQIYITRYFLKTNFTTPESAAIILGIFVGSTIICYVWAFIVSKIPIIKKFL